MWHAIWNEKSMWTGNQYGMEFRMEIGTELNYMWDVCANSVNVGRSPWQVLSWVGSVWKAHGGGFVPQVLNGTERGASGDLETCVG